MNLWKSSKFQIANFQTERFLLGLWFDVYELHTGPEPTGQPPQLGFWILALQILRGFARQGSRQHSVTLDVQDSQVLENSPPTLQGTSSRSGPTTVQPVLALGTLPQQNWKDPHSDTVRWKSSNQDRKKIKSRMIVMIVGFLSTIKLWKVHANRDAQTKEA